MKLARNYLSSPARFATVLFATSLLLAVGRATGAPESIKYEPKPDDPYFAKFNPRLAPPPGPLLLQKGDRLDVIGDSITEQRMYCRISMNYTVSVRHARIAVKFDVEHRGGFIRMEYPPGTFGHKEVALEIVTKASSQFPTTGRQT